MPADPKRVRDVFLEAVELAPVQRPAFLDEACQGVSDLRVEVEKLLAAHADPDSIIEPDPRTSTDATAAFTPNPDETVADSAARPTSPVFVSRISRPTEISNDVGFDDVTKETLAQTHLRPESAPEVTESKHRPDPEATTDEGLGIPSSFSESGSKNEGLGTVIAGRYTLVKVIGEGGMGSVYLARQSEPVKRQVALKLIKTGMDSRGVLARFDAERQALAIMDHPNIARIYDGGLTPAGQPFFVMELVDGVPLTTYCDEKRLSIRARLDLFVLVCHAVQHAHQKGIIHRDLKPGNVLVTEVDGRPTPKVIDFGVAKATEQKLTDLSFADTGAIVGTPTYMSPEQADPSSMDIDTRTDVYALGVMLYELLTGSPPLDAKDFKRGAILEMLRMVREVDPPRPSTKLSTADALPNIAANRSIEPARLSKMLQGELDWVVMKALEKDRARRYDTANGFALDIQRYLADEVVEARPPSRGYRLKKFVLRHKVSVIAAGAVAASLLIGVVAFAWQAKVARDQRDLAVKAEKAEALQRKAADTARKETEVALTESQGKTARMTYERAQALCEGGEADAGLLWMARSLELTPPGDKDLDFAIRTSINLWGRQLNTVGRLWVGTGTNFMLEWQGLRWGPQVRDVALSPDGLTVLLVGSDGIARIFEQATPKLRLVLAAEADPPAGGTFRDGARYSPDGRFVALASSDGRARIWSAATGQLVGKPLVHEDPPTGVGFDPTGRLLVTTAGTKIHVWNLETGDEEGEPVDSGQPIDGVDVGADGRHLMTWSRSPGGVNVWDFATRGRLHPLQEVDFDVDYARFSPDGRWVLAGDSASELAQFWETATGRPIGTRMRWSSTISAGGTFNRPCFRPDGRLIVTGGYPIRMWQVPSGKPLGAVATMMGAQRPMFLADGKILIDYCSMLGCINKQVIDVAPGLEPFALGAGFGDGYNCSLAFAPDGRTMVRTYVRPEQRREFCRLYDLSDGKPIGESRETEGYEQGYGPAPEPSFSSDGRRVATVVGSNDCQILDTTTGREQVPRMAMDRRIRALAFSPDGHLLATGDDQGAVRLWNAATGRAVGPSMAHPPLVRPGKGGPIRLAIRFSPDGRTLLIAGGDFGGYNGFARLWDAATGQPLGPELEITGRVEAAGFSPDGKSFATGAFQLTLWDATTSRKIWTAPSNTGVRQLAFTGEGRKVLARHDLEKAARLYDARTGEPVTPFLRHQNVVVSSALSPDGQLVITSSGDRTVRLWDASLGVPVGPAWPTSYGGDVSFTPDGRGVLMIGDTDGLVRWEIPQPVEGTRERIRLTIEAATRASLDPFGATNGLLPDIQLDPATRRAVLGPDPFEPVGKRLQELGGPTGAFRR